MKSDFSRRQFLKRSAGFAGAATIASKTPHRSQSHSAAQHLRPPSDQVRFGIIGIGMQGSGLLAATTTLPGIECVGAADLWDGRHQLAREITGKSNLPVTRKYQELLDRKDIDCIIAAVPDHWHKRVVVDATAAGKDIYCEKPMSHTAAKASRWSKRKRKTGRIVQIGSQRVSSVICAKAKEMIAAGAIGKLTLVEGWLGRNDPPARGNIRRLRASLPRISIGTPGRAAPRTARGIPICPQNGSRAGAAGGNTAPALPAIFSSISFPA